MMADWKEYPTCGKYQKFTKKTMPPLNHDLILWKGYKDSDGGFPVIARRVQYHDMEPYVRYRVPDDRLWDILSEDEYHDCLWKLAEVPTIVAERMERQEQRERERALRKELEKACKAG